MTNTYMRLQVVKSILYRLKIVDIEEMYLS